MSLIRDGGVRSRKLWMAAGTSVGLVLCGVLCGYVPALIPLYDTMVGGLIGVYALYSGVNLGAKHILKKGVDPAAHAGPAEPPVEASPPA